MMALMIGWAGGCEAHQAKPIFALSPAEIFHDPGLRQLAQAAQHGNVKEINVLIAKGVDVNGHGKYGIGPLFSAWQALNKKGYKALLEHGANPNNIWSNGYTLLNAIAMTPDPYFMRLALEHGANPNLAAPVSNETPIFKAVRPRGKVNLQLLIHAGANLNHQDNDGETPLMVAADLSQYDAVYKLLLAGANFRLKDKWGKDIRWNIKQDEKYMDKSGAGGVWLQKVVNFLKAHDFWPPPESQQYHNNTNDP